jgi:hypothetical protein
VNVVLVKKKDSIQCLVYYSSQTFHDVETRYLKVKNIALALVKTSRKLKLYLQAHQVIILTD